MPNLIRTQWLPASRERVFEFFADAANLEPITPPELRFQILTPLPVEMRVGARIEYRLRLFGIPFGWLTEITEWEPGQSFVDQQIRGPYGSWVHRHSFRDERGGTRMDDHVAYALPFMPVGAIASPIVARQLRRIFDYRERTIEERLGSG